MLHSICEIEHDFEIGQFHCSYFMNWATNHLVHEMSSEVFQFYDMSNFINDAQHLPYEIK